MLHQSISYMIVLLFCTEIEHWVHCDGPELSTPVPLVTAISSPSGDRSGRFNSIEDAFLRWLFQILFYSFLSFSILFISFLFFLYISLYISLYILISSHFTRIEAFGASFFAFLLHISPWLWPGALHGPVPPIAGARSETFTTLI